MIHIENTTEFKTEADTAVTIGKFDGIHKGHAKILNEVLAHKTEGLLSAVFTFDTPPTSVFFKENQKVLTTNAEKRELFRTMGIDYLVEFPFYEKTAAISAEDFIEEFLVDSLHAKVIVVGSDCRFGHLGTFPAVCRLASRSLKQLRIADEDHLMFAKKRSAFHKIQQLGDRWIGIHRAQVHVPFLRRQQLSNHRTRHI